MITNQLFKVAILQKRSINEKQRENVDTILKYMKEAAENKADILLLPECFITGYDLPMTYEKSISDDDENISEPFIRMGQANHALHEI